VLDAKGEPIPWLRGGQALMNAAFESARELGAKRLLLGTNAGNKRAIEFYVRNGFAEVGQRTFEVGSQVCTDFILAKTV
jgi:ribosomal protein S18 acetylase RimI-like enzyme